MNALCVQNDSMYPIHSSYVWKWVLLWRRWLHYSCSGSTNKHDFAHLKKKWIHIGMWSRKTLCFGMQDKIVSFSFLTFSFSFAWMDGWMSVPHNNATCLTGPTTEVYIQQQLSWPLRLATFYSLDVGINVNEYPTKNEKKCCFAPHSVYLNVQLAFQVVAIFVFVYLFRLQLWTREAVW